MPEIYYEAGKFKTESSISPESRDKGNAPRPLKTYSVGDPELGALLKYLSQNVEIEGNDASPADIINYLIEHPDQAIKYTLPKHGIK